MLRPACSVGQSLLTFNYGETPFQFQPPSAGFVAVDGANSPQADRQSSTKKLERRVSDQWSPDNPQLFQADPLKFEAVPESTSPEDTGAGPSPFRSVDQGPFPPSVPSLISLSFLSSLLLSLSLSFSLALSLPLSLSLIPLAPLSNRQATRGPLSPTARIPPYFSMPGGTTARMLAFCVQRATSDRSVPLEAIVEVLCAVWKYNFSGIFRSAITLFPDHPDAFKRLQQETIEFEQLGRLNATEDDTPIQQKGPTPPTPQKVPLVHFALERNLSTLLQLALTLGFDLSVLNGQGETAWLKGLGFPVGRTGLLEVGPRTIFLKHLDALVGSQSSSDRVTEPYFQPYANAQRRLDAAKVLFEVTTETTTRKAKAEQLFEPAKVAFQLGKPLILEKVMSSIAKSSDAFRILQRITLPSPIDKDNSSLPLLHYAVASGKATICAAALTAGFDPYLLDSRERSAFDLARPSSNLSVRKLFNHFGTIYGRLAVFFLPFYPSFPLYLPSSSCLPSSIFLSSCIFLPLSYLRIFVSSFLPPSINSVLPSSIYFVLPSFTPSFLPLHHAAGTGRSPGRRCTSAAPAPWWP